MAHPDHGDRLFATRWVHLYEQDTAGSEVYGPEDGPVPLSRRPREYLELKADGSATLFTAGADDRPTPQAARWTDQDGTITLRPDAGGPALRIVERSASRIVVRRSSTR